MFKFLNKNTRFILIEKFVVPEWFEMFLLDNPSCLHNNSSRETYRVILRVLNGDDITITRNTFYSSETEINKWRKNPEKINYPIFSFLHNHGFISLDSGNDETREEHYNIFAINGY